MLLAAASAVPAGLAVATALVLRADDTRNGYRPPTRLGRALVRLDNAGLDAVYHLRTRSLEPRPAAAIPAIWTKEVPV